MLRTIAVWNRAPFVTVPLVIATLVLWGLILRGTKLDQRRWSDNAGRCLVEIVPLKFLAAIYLYSELISFCLSPVSWHRKKLTLDVAMLFDFVVLVLATIRLFMSPVRCQLWHLLFRQGVVYFLVAFVANLVPTIFYLLNLNGVYFFLLPRISLLPSP